jgi:hypothetical protein
VIKAPRDGHRGARFCLMYDLTQRPELLPACGAN